jgi:hypothetical protein
MTDKPNKATRLLNKIGKKIDKAFSPKAMKKMKDKLETARAKDPKFQEWKKKRDAFEPIRQKAKEAGEKVAAERAAKLAADHEGHKKWLDGIEAKKKAAREARKKEVKESYDGDRHPLERLPKPVRSKLVTQVHPSDRMKVQKVLLEDPDGIRKFMAGEVGFRRIA